MIGTLKVSPEQMQTAASELSGYISAMEQNFRAMQNVMDSSASYWNGLAGDAHRQLYSQQIAKTQEIIARYTEHVADLNTMAGVYSDAEVAAQSRVEDLPQSVL